MPPPYLTGVQGNSSLVLVTYRMLPPYLPLRSRTTGSSGRRSLSAGSLPAFTISARAGASVRLAGTLSSRYDFGSGASAGFAAGAAAAGLAASAGFAAAAGAVVAAAAARPGFAASAAGFAASAGLASTVRGVSTGFGADWRRRLAASRQQRHARRAESSRGEE